MISIVIPVYNEEENIETLYSRLISSSPSWGDTFEILFVDDGSMDRSLEMLREKAVMDSRVKVVKLTRNFGHQAAISAGIMMAKGDAVVIMDGDLQDPPEELSRFLQYWRDGYEVVYAVRKNRKEGIFKKVAYSTFYRILKAISNINIPLDSGDFCVMDRKVVHALNHEMRERNRFVRGLRAYAGFKQIGVEYDRSSRFAGAPKYTFSKLLKLALDGIFDFSTFPLRIASYVGWTIAFSSLLIGLFFIISRLTGIKLLGYKLVENPGITTLAVAVFFLCGVILIILGILGEYIGRIYNEVKERPFYIIDRERPQGKDQEF